jgi:lipopolysaccharide heptosyltransferase II
MKILIIRLSSIGDIVLTQPIVAALREQYPAAELHYVTKAAFFPILQSFGMPLHVHAYEELQSVGSLITFGAAQHFDLVLDLHNKLNTFIIKSLVRGKQTCTYTKKHTVRRRIVRHKTSETIVSTVNLYFTALQKAGIDYDAAPPVLYPNQALQSAPLTTLKKLKMDPTPLIGLFPGAQHTTKQYPIAQLAEAVTLIARELPCRFAVLGSASEQHLAHALAQQTSVEIHDFCGSFNLAELIHAITHLDVIISNDSGPMHIAAALAKPQIAIFGATHPHLGFAPLNASATILQAPLPCRPCSLHGTETCPLNHFNCMHSITPKEVATATIRLLSR